MQFYLIQINLMSTDNMQSTVFCTEENTKKKVYNTKKFKLSSSFIKNWQYSYKNV